jgi:hypothetical protein
MAIKVITPLKDGFTYPVCMLDGTVRELYHSQDRFFDDKANDVSELVSYRVVWVDVPYRRKTSI